MIAADIFVLIAQSCIDYEAPLITCDSDFRHLASCYKQCPFMSQDRPNFIVGATHLIPLSL